MNAAIFCPGPSLANVTQRDVDRYPLRIAVNRAALRIDAHCWAALDYPIIRDYRDQVLGSPALLTHSTTWNDIGHKVTPFPRVIHLEDVEAWYGHKFFRRTTPAAILLAGFLSAKTIDIYGDDKSQKPDFDGHQTAETMMARAPERWASEAKDCEAICEWLALKGVVVQHK